MPISLFSPMAARTGTAAESYLIKMRNIPSDAIGSAIKRSNSQWIKNVAFTDSVTGSIIPNGARPMFGNGVDCFIQHLNSTDPGDTALTDLTALNAAFTGHIVSDTLGDGTTGNVFEVGPLTSPITTTVPQSPFAIISDPADGFPAINSMYISYIIKLPSNLASILETTKVNNRYWVTFHDQKTGGIDGASQDKGDYRTSLSIDNSFPGGLTWKVQGDNIINPAWGYAADPSYAFHDEYWYTETTGVPVPVGEYFQLEFYCLRPGFNTYSPLTRDTTTGRTVYALRKFVGGHLGARTIIHDQVGGIQMGYYNLPWTRIIAPNPYSGGVPMLFKYYNWELAVNAPVPF